MQGFDNTTSPERQHLASRDLSRLFEADTFDDVYAGLGAILAEFDITRFSIFALHEQEAQLEFSKGMPDGPSSAFLERIALDGADGLKTFLQQHDSVWIPSDETDWAANIPFLKDATAIFSVRFHGQAQGFVVLHGLVSTSVLKSPGLDEISYIFSLFGIMFQRVRSMAALRRAYAGTSLRLNELITSRDILLMSDTEAVYNKVITRVVETLSCKSGSIWLWNGQKWDMGYLVGSPSTEGMAEVDRLLKATADEGAPVAVNSLSGDFVSVFDSDTIHMVAAMAFPIIVRDKRIGCVIAFDATVSQNAIEVIHSTVLLAGIAIENLHQRKQMLDQQRMQEQLAVAAQIQQRLLPDATVDNRDLSITFFSRYCDETGGDYVDAIAGEEPNIMTFAVGDVAGHGLGAALLMVDIRSQMRTLLRVSDPTCPHEILRRVNEALCLESAAEDFATLVLATLDLRTGVFSYASAGHEPALIFRAATGEWQELESTGVPIGMLPDMSWTTERLFLEQDDVVLFLTDGVTEALDRTGQPFGRETVKAALQKNAAADGKAVLDAVVQTTLNQCDPSTFVDDVTFLLVKVKRVGLQILTDVPPPPGEQLFNQDFQSSQQEKDKYLDDVINLLCDRYPTQDLSGVFMAAEEALANAVLHGNRGDEHLLVHVEVWGEDESVSVVVHDQGKGFDPRKRIPTAFDEATLHEESGRGVLMMVAMMDEVKYADEGRKVSMTKKLGDVSETDVGAEL